MVNMDDQIEEVPVPTGMVDSTKDKSSPPALAHLQTMGVGEASPARAGSRFYMTLISLYLVLFIGALDQTIIATSIPTITSDLNSADGYAWFGTAYLLANAATGPIWAKFSDIWGRKPALLGAIISFAIGSLIAALSSSARMLIASRALQGAAAGGLGLLVSVTFSDLFSVRKRALYLGIRELIWALAGGIGPLLGGALTQYASWRWNFWINLPVCAIAFVLLFVYLDVHKPRTAFKDGIRAFDWLGALLMIGTVLMILLGLDFGGIQFSWSSPTVLCLIIFGVLAVGVFLYIEKFVAKHPIMPLRVFQHRSRNVAMAIGFLNGMVYISLPYYLPLYLQSTKAATPLQSGLLILPLIIPGTAAGFASGVLIDRFGRYIEFIWIGMGLLTLTTGLYTTFSPTTPLAVVGVLEALGGISLAMLFQAPVLVIQNAVSASDTSAAIATYSLTRNLSTAISLVLGGIVFQNGMHKQISALQSAGLSPQLLSAFSNGQAAANINLIRNITDANQQRAVEYAFSDALRDMWIMYTCIAGVGFLLSALLRHVDLKTEHTEVKTGLKRDEEPRRDDAA